MSGVEIIPLTLIGGLYVLQFLLQKKNAVANNKWNDAAGADRIRNSLGGLDFGVLEDIDGVDVNNGTVDVDRIVNKYTTPEERVKLINRLRDFLPKEVSDDIRNVFEVMKTHFIDTSQPLAAILSGVDNLLQTIDGNGWGRSVEGGDGEHNLALATRRAVASLTTVFEAGGVLAKGLDDKYVFPNIVFPPGGGGGDDKSPDAILFAACTAAAEQLQKFQASKAKIQATVRATVRAMGVSADVQATMGDDMGSMVDFLTGEYNNCREANKDVWEKLQTRWATHKRSFPSLRDNVNFEDRDGNVALPALDIVLYDVNDIFSKAQAFVAALTKVAGRNLTARSLLDVAAGGNGGDPEKSIRDLLENGTSTTAASGASTTAASGTDPSTSGASTTTASGTSTSGTLASSSSSVFKDIVLRVLESRKELAEQANPYFPANFKKFIEERGNKIQNAITTIKNNGDLDQDNLTDLITQDPYGPTQELGRSVITWIAWIETQDFGLGELEIGLSRTALEVFIDGTRGGMYHIQYAHGYSALLGLAVNTEDIPYFSRAITYLQTIYLNKYNKTEIKNYYETYIVNNLPLGRVLQAFKSKNENEKFNSFTEKFEELTDYVENNFHDDIINDKVDEIYDLITKSTTPSPFPSTPSPFPPTPPPPIPKSLYDGLDPYNKELVDRVVNSIGTDALDGLGPQDLQDLGALIPDDTDDDALKNLRNKMNDALNAAEQDAAKAWACALALMMMKNGGGGGDGAPESEELRRLRAENEQLKRTQKTKTLYDQLPEESKESVDGVLDADNGELNTSAMVELTIPETLVVPKRVQYMQNILKNEYEAFQIGTGTAKAETVKLFALLLAYMIKYDKYDNDDAGYEKDDEGYESTRPERSPPAGISETGDVAFIQGLIEKKLDELIRIALERVVIADKQSKNFPQHNDHELLQKLSNALDKYNYSLAFYIALIMAKRIHNTRKFSVVEYDSDESDDEDLPLLLQGDDDNIAELERLRQELERLRNQRDYKGEDDTQLDHDIAKTEDELNKLIRKLKKRIGELEEELQNVSNGDQDKLKQELDELKRQLEEAEQALKRIPTLEYDDDDDDAEKIRELEGKIRELEGKIRELEDENKRLRAGNLKGDSNREESDDEKEEKLKEQIAELENRIKELDDELALMDQLNANLGEAQANFDEAQAELEKLKAELKELQAKKQNAPVGDDDSKQLLDKIAALEEALQKARKRAGRGDQAERAEREREREKLEKLEKQLKELREQLLEQLRQRLNNHIGNVDNASRKNACKVIQTYSSNFSNVKELLYISKTIIEGKGDLTEHEITGMITGVNPVVHYLKNMFQYGADAREALEAFSNRELTGLHMSSSIIRNVQDQMIEGTTYTLNIQIVDNQFAKDIAEKRNFTDYFNALKNLVTGKVLSKTKREELLKSPCDSCFEYLRKKLRAKTPRPPDDHIINSLIMHIRDCITFAQATNDPAQHYNIAKHMTHDALDEYVTEYRENKIEIEILMDKPINKKAIKTAFPSNKLIIGNYVIGMYNRIQDRERERVPHYPNREEIRIIMETIGCNEMDAYQARKYDAQDRINARISRMPLEICREELNKCMIIKNLFENILRTLDEFENSNNPIYWPAIVNCKDHINSGHFPVWLIKNLKDNYEPKEAPPRYFYDPTPYYSNPQRFRRDDRTFESDDDDFTPEPTAAITGYNAALINRRPQSAMTQKTSINLPSAPFINVDNLVNLITSNQVVIVHNGTNIEKKDFQLAITAAYAMGFNIINVLKNVSNTALELTSVFYDNDDEKRYIKIGQKKASGTLVHKILDPDTGFYIDQDRDVTIMRLAVPGVAESDDLEAKYKDAKEYGWEMHGQAFIVHKWETQHSKILKSLVKTVSDTISDTISAGNPATNPATYADQPLFPPPKFQFSDDGEDDHEGAGGRRAHRWAQRGGARADDSPLWPVMAVQLVRVGHYGSVLTRDAGVTVNDLVKDAVYSIAAFWILYACGLMSERSVQTALVTVLLSWCLVVVYWSGANLAYGPTTLSEPPGKAGLCITAVLLFAVPMGTCCGK